MGEKSCTRGIELDKTVWGGGAQEKNTSEGGKENTHFCIQLL